MPIPDKNIGAKLRGFTPLMDVLIQEYGLVTAAVWGRMWRYAQQDDKVCTAANEKIARELGLDRRTIIRHIKTLVDNGYVIDETPDIKHKPHIYSMTDKATVRVLVEGVTESHTYPVGGVTESHTRGDRESHKESIKKDSISEKIDLILSFWKELFPDKPQPRATTKYVREKVKARMSDEHFAENWQVAMERASDSITCQTESWFNFKFFVNNDENYQKCLDRWMDWKDEQKKGGNGRGNNGRNPPAEKAGTGWTSTENQYNPDDVVEDCKVCWCTPCICGRVKPESDADDWERVAVFNNALQERQVYVFLKEEVTT